MIIKTTISKEQWHELNAKIKPEVTRDIRHNAPSHIRIRTWTGRQLLTNKKLFSVDEVHDPMNGEIRYYFLGDQKTLTDISMPT